VGIGNGIRVLIASRKQYLPDFLHSYVDAEKSHLQFNVLQTIEDPNEQVEFIDKIRTWSKRNGLVEVEIDAGAAKLLARQVDGHPLKMMLALIEMFSQNPKGRITEAVISRLRPWEQLFGFDEQALSKDKLDKYFVLAMAHARTEIVRFKEVW